MVNSQPNQRAQNEVQQIAVLPATSGTFALATNDDETGPWSCNASASDVQAALAALPGMGSSVAVSGNPGGPWTVTFEGDLADTVEPLIVADTTGLTYSLQIAVSSSGGYSGPDSVQSVVVTALGGTFTLTFDGDTTGPNAYGAAAAAVQAALDALANIGPGGVSVSGSGTSTNPYQVTFGQTW